MKTLLIEDQVLDAELVTKCLEKMGGKVTVAKNGVSAIRIYDESEWDLIISDIDLAKVIDGVDILRYVRQEKSKEELPVLLVTARQMDKDRREHLKALGANEVCSKWESVFNSLRKYAEQYDEKSKAEEATTTLMNSTPALKFTLRTIAMA